MADKIQSDILVYTVADALDDTTLSPASKKLLLFAHHLTDSQVVAVAPARVKIGTLTEFGASRVFSYQVSQPVEACLGGFVADTLMAVIPQLEVGAVFLPSTNWGKQATAQLAARLRSVGSVDITEIKVEGNQLQLTKNVLGGTWNTSFTLRRGIPVVAVRTVGLPEEPITSNHISTQETLETPLSPANRRIKVVAASVNEGGMGRLHDAAAVVCGGRGTFGDFKPVNTLAEILDAAVGSTRVVCEEGWMPRSAQVGQSGALIAPHLYIGLGISGDPYHMCGIRAARKIVAVNNDPQAEIFRFCDFGVVGDLQTVVAQAIAHLRES